MQDGSLRDPREGARMIAGILVIGLVLIASALKGTQHELGEQAQADFLGRDGFVAWAGAILGIGAIGYIPGLRTSSRYLLLLIGTVMIVRNQGVFAQVQQALVSASSAGPAPSIASPSVSSSGGGSAGSSGAGGVGQPSGSSGSSGVGDLASIASIAAIALA